MIRVLIVDDSETSRMLLTKILESDPDIQVVGTAGDGVAAVELARRLRPDLITMDFRMPRMDGLRATEEIMATCPTPIVIVSASVDAPDLQITFNALRAGALDVLEKPRGLSGEAFDRNRSSIVRTIRAMSQIPVVRRKARQPREDMAALPAKGEGHFDLIAIGASTGGPPLLAEILGALPASFSSPVVIVQHMTPGFTEGLVRWLAHEAKMPVVLAQDGASLRGGHVYIAPDHTHLRVTEQRRITLGSDPPVERFRPSVDVLFESVAAAIGPSAVGVILTGMGSDGARGLLAMKRAGGWTIAQDSASATVDGMPAAARRLMAVDQILTPAELPPLLMKCIGMPTP